MDLLLASTSAYRRALLGRIGVPFRWRAPRIDEDTYKNLGLPPRRLAEELARAKAASLAPEEREATVIACDQVVEFEGQILGKPGDRARAIEQLKAIAGRQHRLITSLAVWHRGNMQVCTDESALLMRPLTTTEVTRYVDFDQPWDCAGGYKLESRGIVLFERIDSADHSAITGLPLIALTTILRCIGYQIP
jgi:septum formation protein